MWKKLRKKITKLPRWMINPVYITASLFLFWMLFMDDNDFFNQYRRYHELSALLEKKSFYVQQIKKTNLEYFELTTSPTTQEKFAREHYRMKKDDEDVFVLVPERQP